MLKLLLSCERWNFSSWLMLLDSIKLQNDLVFVWTYEVLFSLKIQACSTGFINKIEESITQATPVWVHICPRIPDSMWCTKLFKKLIVMNSNSVLIQSIIIITMWCHHNINISWYLYSLPTSHLQEN